jgi:MATE family multidrug resistance protein
MVAMGLSVASMIRVGNQKGLKDYKNLRRIAESIFFVGTIFAIIFALFFVVFHQYLPHLYVNLDDASELSDITEVIEIASTLLLAAAVFQISDSLQVIVLGALRGLQDVKIPTLITFIAYWLIGFPISYFLGKEDAYGSLGIWIGLVAGLTSAAILLYIRFHYLTKRLILQQDNT